MAIRAGYYELTLDEVAVSLDDNGVASVSTNPLSYTAEDLKRELDIVRGYPLVER